MFPVLNRIACIKSSLMCTRTHKRLIKHVPGSVFSPSKSSPFMSNLWQDTLQLMERSEQLVRLITHVCCQKLSGVFRTSYPPTLSCCCGDASNESCCSPQDSGPFIVAPYLRSGDDENPGSGGRPWGRVPPCPSWRRFPGCIRGSGAGPPTATKWKPRSTSWSLRARLIASLLLLLLSFASVVESCSSRSTPKPRPASPTLRPNVTFQTYACPPAYAAWFCLNGATCFTVKIQDAILYNCECAEGYMGPRCEYKDLDGSYLPASQRVLLETASIAGGACIAIVLVFMVLFALYVFMHKDREKRSGLESPYHDKRLLRSAEGGGPDYVCTITPLHIGAPTFGFLRNEQFQVPLVTDKRATSSFQDLYFVSGLSPPACFCQTRTMACQQCGTPPHSYVLPSDVPKCV